MGHAIEPVLSVILLAIVPTSWARCAPVIDAHTHLDFSGAEDEVSGLLDTREVFTDDAQRACLVGVVAHLPAGAAPASVDVGLPIVECAGVEDPSATAALEDALASGAGCIKIYLGYAPHFASEYGAVYAIAERAKVPVVFHTGDTSTSEAKLKYADPLTIDEVAVDHPNVTFVIAHLGNPWIESAAEVAYKNPNVYIEASGMFVGTRSEMGRRTLRATVIRPLRWAFLYMEDPSKLMFGSDWPIASIGDTAWAYRRAIPRRYRRQVFYENALRVFPGLDAHLTP